MKDLLGVGVLALLSSVRVLLLSTHEEFPYSETRPRGWKEGTIPAPGKVQSRHPANLQALQVSCVKASSCSRLFLSYLPLLFSFFPLFFFFSFVQYHWRWFVHVDESERMVFVRERLQHSRQNALLSCEWLRTLNWKGARCLCRVFFSMSSDLRCVVVERSAIAHIERYLFLTVGTDDRRRLRPRQQRWIPTWTYVTPRESAAQIGLALSFFIFRSNVHFRISIYMLFLSFFLLYFPVHFFTAFELKTDWITRKTPLLAMATLEAISTQIAS